MSELLRILVFVGLAGLAFVPLEHLYGRHRGSRRDRLTDLGFATVGQALVQLGLLLGIGGLFGALEVFSLEEPLLAAVRPRWLRMATEVGVGLLLFELMGYAYHRLAHAVPTLWRFHAVHHSSERMDWLASFRQHPVEIVLVTVAQNAPLLLLGIPLGSHALVLLLLRLNTVFVHADLELPRGWWSELVATPRFHHRHHQRDGAPRNFAAMFPWLDRLFGTHDAGRANRVGLPAPTPRTLWGLLAHPFFAAARPGSRSPSRPG